MIQGNLNFPHFIKYMGSKTEIIDFVLEGINEVHKDGQAICDLFSGSATLAGALRYNTINFISNDIQLYSAILSKVYLNNYENIDTNQFNEFMTLVENRVNEFKNYFNELNTIDSYPEELTLDQFHEIESKQRDLQNYTNFEDFDKYYIFTKNYSGTYWKYEQCIWIDSIRGIAERYKENESFYNAILASLMYAMAYNSQGTGHYAQYRDAADESSMIDIMIYRNKDIKSYFVRKFNSIISDFNPTDIKFTATAKNYIDCAKNLPTGTLIYADPPYGKVHYSRFYHILETLVKYDHPELKYKGRYRTDRHQSPFCKTSTVNKAFEDLFDVVKTGNHELILSYSDGSANAINLKELLLLLVQSFTEVLNIEKVTDFITSIIQKQLTFEGMSEITSDEELIITDILENLKLVIGSEYQLTIKKLIHNHSTMGRREDKHREVKEILIIVKRNP